MEEKNIYQAPKTFTLKTKCHKGKMKSLQHERLTKVKNFNSKIGSEITSCINGFKKNCYFNYFTLNVNKGSTLFTYCIEDLFCVLSFLNYVP